MFPIRNRMEWKNVNKINHRKQRIKNRININNFNVDVWNF